MPSSPPVKFSKITFRYLILSNDVVSPIANIHSYDLLPKYFDLLTIVCVASALIMEQTLDKKLNSYEKTELIYKILADEENEKAKKIARLRELRLGRPSTGAQHEK